jgi:endonuclease YncB( thermonuclease family)
MLSFVQWALVLSVVSVADGDTLTLQDGATRTTVRLAEIDAPERTQPYSQVARRNLTALCQSAQRIRLEPVSTDRYGRTVAHLWCDDIHVNWRQVEDGLAWCFTKYLKDPRTCRPLEANARAAQRGLWRDPTPVAPWDFRAAAMAKTPAAAQNAAAVQPPGRTTP